MIRRSEAVGLATVVILALSAFVVQAAVASPLTVNVIKGTTVHFTGDQETGHKFTTPNGSVSCVKASFDATAVAGEAGAIAELTVIPTYSECSAFGFATAHVKTNECKYTFTTPTSLGGGVVTWHPSQLHIVCPAGKSVEITPTTFGVSACTQFVGEQTPTAGHVVGRNVASSEPGDVTLETTLEGVHYTGTGGLCGNGETHSDAKYTGNSTGSCSTNLAHTARVECTFS